MSSGTVSSTTFSTGDRSSSGPPRSAERPDYVPWLSWGRVIGIVAIVAIHVFGHLVYEYGQVSGLEWHVANLVQSAGRFGVPVFVLVSGAALLGVSGRGAAGGGAAGSRAESLRDFYRRRAARVAVPLVVWTAFFLWFDRWMLDQPVTAYTFVQGYLWGRPYYHLYFLYVVAGLYLITPFLRVFVAHASRRMVALAAATCLALAAADKLQHAWMGGGGGFNAFTYFVPWIGYYLLGSVLLDPDVRRRIARSTARWHWLLAYVGSVVVATGLTAWLFPLIGNRTLQVTYDYFVPMTLVAAVSAVVLLQRAERSHGAEGTEGTEGADRAAATAGSPTTPLGRRLGDLTLGVFLLHPIPLAFVRAHQPEFAAGWVNLVFHALTVVGLLAGCALVTLLVRRIPGLRRLV